MKRAAVGIVPTIALLVAACSGGSETESPDATSAADVVVKSLENFRRIQSFQADVNTRTRAEGLDVATIGNATLEDGALLYAQLVFDSGEEEQAFSELLFASPDLYMKQSDGQWFVLSPWNQGQRPDELSDFSPEDLVVNYEEIAANLTGVEERGEETIDGDAFLHFAGDVDFKKVYPEAPDTADGDVHADLFLSKTDYLPRRVRIVTTFKLGDARLVEDATFDFHDYDQPIVHPPRPADARPWRDLQALEAPCTGEALAACLEAQAELEATGSDSCVGEGLRICLVPLGQIDPQLVQHVAEVARTDYGIETVVMSPKPLTESMVDDLRGQLEGGSALDYLGQVYPLEYDDPEVVLFGLTSVDMYLSTSHFRYTFGVYDSSGHHAVLSSFRMDPRSFGEAADADLLEERFRKYFLRNVGTLYWGYDENAEPTSLMFRDLLSLDDLDRMEEPLPTPQ